MFIKNVSGSSALENIWGVYVLLRIGSHTVAAYSTIGLTSELYAFCLQVVEPVFRFLRRKPNGFFFCFSTYVVNVVNVVCLA